MDKLSTNSIFNLYQDKQGFIWIGTAYGLERYDGYDIQPFINNYMHPHKLSHNDIRCFAEDDDYLWVGTLQGLNLLNKITFELTPFADTRLLNKEIKDLRCDWKGDIWVATAQCLYRCDAERGVLKEYPLMNDGSTFFEDSDGTLWFLTWNGGILKYDRQRDIFVAFAQMGNNNPYRMTQDNQGRYWIVTWGSGIWRFDPHSDKKETMFHRQSIVNPVRHFPEQVFYDIVQDDAYGYIWALSHFRLYVFQINARNELEEVDINTIKDINQPIDQYKTYSRVIKDQTGNLWLGAYDQGYTVAFEKAEILNFTMDNMKKKLGLDANILYINKDAKGIIWCDQSRFGLCLYDEQTGRTTYGSNPNALYSISVASIIPSRQDDAVWLVGRNDMSTRIWKMKQEQMRIITLEQYDLKSVAPSPGSISQLVEDDHGNIFVGTSAGMFFKPAASNIFVKLPFDIPLITDMHKDSKGHLWICSPKEVYQMTTREGKPALLKRYGQEAMPWHEGEFKRISAAGNAVWFATSLGQLFRLDTQDQQVSELTEVCGLKGDNILEIIAHGDRVWVMCDKYIVCHHVRRKENTTYSVNDANIFVTSFRHSAAFVDHEGCLYAGGHNGFIKIWADGQDIKRNETGQVFVTDVMSDNRSLLFSPVQREVGNSVHRVTLLPQARNIEVSFSALSYTSGRRIRYAYQLEGVDQDWVYIENGKHTAFYNRLDKGDNTLRIKATDPYGNWMKEEQRLTLHRLPAWHETWYAYVLFTLGVLLCFYLLFHAYSQRLARRNNLRLQEELTQIKLNYFTNVSHELLTPLTIISCVADDLEENKAGSERQVETLRTNANRLKRLLHQMLDFRKVESGKMKLNVSYGNISSFISGMVATNFQPLAQNKKISLTTCVADEVWGYLDMEKLDNIVFNLFSNALKYTLAHKNITLAMEVVVRNGNRYMLLRVEDEGIGIAEKDMKQIFTKYYNNRNNLGYKSNGIGLSLTKELVTLHHGRIAVSSVVGQGSQFSVEIPIDKEAYNEHDIIDTFPEAVQEEKVQLLASDDKPCILFIDDNHELCELIFRIFNKSYQILIAANGLEGLEILRNNTVDIVICDVVMPHMDGLEFCRLTKKDVQTNHIPIIMLTAKNAPDDQIECYKAGAESYIAKPFDMNILRARIHNLLESRALSWKGFRSRMEINFSNMNFPNPDETFLNEAMECVQRHIQEPDFDTVQMAEELNMSRSTLSRKCKVITGCTPLEFIRNIKLKYACTLLRNKGANVSEVAFATGFSYPKYFSKCFKDEFGMTPTEFQQSAG